MNMAPIQIYTNIDRICEVLRTLKSADLSSLSKHTKIKVLDLKRLISELEDAGMVVVEGKSIRLFTEGLNLNLPTVEGEVIDKYALKKHNVPATVRILNVKEDPRPYYEFTSVDLGIYTARFLEYLQELIAHKISLEPQEIIDPRKTSYLEDKFYKESYNLVSKHFPGLDEEGKSILAGVLLHKVFGMDRLELIMEDDNLEEIVVNGSSEPVVVYHKKYGWLKTNLLFKSEKDIYNLATLIARKAGREINLMHPIMDAHLPNGDRVNATLFPISSYGDTITIRRFVREPWTIVDFTSPQLNTMSVEMGAFLWQAMQYEMNLLVVGGTASGKTSALNTLAALIPPSNRIITIEDTREINLPQYLKYNWIPLVTRNPSSEGKGGVSMLDLMVASLRMRPDRVIVGEVRRREEAEVLFEAMHTGHAVYSTMHADTGDQVLRRLMNPPIEIPPTEMESLHLIVVMYRDRRTGRRRVYEIDEAVLGVGGEVNLNRVYRWRARNDTFERINDSTRVYNELNMHAGMTIDEIARDLDDKSKVLRWMQKFNVRSIDRIGSVMSVYYKEPSLVVEAAEKGLPPEKIL